MRALKQSTARDVMVFMTDSADHITGKASLTLTITASKNGAAFASVTPTVTERGNGWYALSLTTAHTDTLGDLALHITASGADPTDVVMVVKQEFRDLIARSNTLQATGNTTTAAKLDASASSQNDQYNGMLIYFTGGTGAGAASVITDYDGTTKIATLAGVPVAGDSTTTFIVVALPGIIAMTAADVRSALGLASANLDTQLAALPVSGADALLKRDMSAVTGEASRSPLNALRFLRNLWSVSGGTLTVKKEDDSTTAWTGAVSTSPGADPISGVDPT